MLLPYTDSDVRPVMLSLLDNPDVAPLLAQICPNMEALRRTVTELSTIDELQRKVMLPQVDRIIADSMTGFTYTISSRLDPSWNYLFVANHRDILLDAMLLVRSMTDVGFETPRIIFGSNLLSIPLMAELSRLNKLVSMDRGGSPRDFYQCLSDASRYIRQSITVDHQSVWIAQRNGRTKDGNDRTDTAVVKMLAMSAPKGATLTEALSVLHIVPVAISYEWEPCDLLKVRELCAPQPYVKAPDDDFRSVVTGLTQPKGQVHLAIDDPLTDAELADCHNDPHQVAELLDRRIHAAYQLHPSNCDSTLLQNRLIHLANKQEKEKLIELYQAPAKNKKME